MPSEKIKVFIEWTREKVKHNIEVKYIDLDRAHEIFARYIHGTATRKENIWAMSIIRRLEQGKSKLY
jgi:hypothetical protein